MKFIDCNIYTSIALQSIAIFDTTSKSIQMFRWCVRVVVIVVEDNDLVVNGVHFSRAVGVRRTLPYLLDVVVAVAPADKRISIYYQLTRSPV